MHGGKTGIRLGMSRSDRVNAVLTWLTPIAAPVADKAEYTRWISSRMGGDPDQAENWCLECAKSEVDRLNALHPDHDYLVDGGWGSSTDTPPLCSKCGKALNDHFTEHAILYEADHYSRTRVNLSGESRAETAFRFVQAFSSDDFDGRKPEMWRFFRKVERMMARRRAQLVQIEPFSAFGTDKVPAHTRHQPS